MKHILFVYPKMMIGGSTTSLLSILNNIDLENYKVDLLLAEHKGELLNDIPNGINLLPCAIPDFNLIRKKKLMSKKYFFNFLKSRVLSFKHRNILISQQISAADNAELSLPIEKEYDVAISFLELWPTYYVAQKVTSKKKIGWIHVDYKSTGFLSELDTEHFSKFDDLIMVSNKCLNNFNQLFPNFKKNTSYIENILSEKRIQNLAREPLNDFLIVEEKINIVTVCRIDFRSKALDRTIKIFNKLNKERLLKDVCWYIVGDGPELKDLKELIQKYQLGGIIKPIGKRLNPYNIVSKCDIFLLASHYEGKPMAVTEAMILGVPPLVTAYSSAEEQIKDGLNGHIFENNSEAIYKGLKKILLNPEIIEIFKKNLKSEEHSNINEMGKIYNLIN